MMIWRICRTALSLTALVLNPSIGSTRDLWCDALESVPRPTESRIAELAGHVVDDAPYPLPQIKTEGLLPGQGIHDASQVAKRDFPKIQALAYGWRTTAQPRHLESAYKFILAWSLIYQPSINPIDETEFSQLFEAYAVIRDDLAVDRRSIVDPWIRRFYVGYLNDMQKRQREGNVQTSNWQSHRIKIAVAAAVALGEPDLLAPLQPLYEAQVKANIRRDGSTEDFHKRDALSYATYSLLPLVETVLMARAAGASWGDQGSSTRTRLLSALDWMMPYATRQKVHIEYKHSTVRFDQIRTDRGVERHAQVEWNPMNARDLFWYAAYLDRKYLTVAKALNPQPSSFLVACRGTLTTR